MAMIVQTLTNGIGGSEELRGPSVETADSSMLSNDALRRPPGKRRIIEFAYCRERYWLVGVT